MTNGTRLAVYSVRTVRGTLTGEVMTLHRTGESLAFAHGGDIDQFASGEYVDGQLIADGDVANVVKAKLDQLWPGGHSAFGEMSGLRAGEALRLLFTPGDLNS